MTQKSLTFTNPLQYVDGQHRTDPDPFVMRYRGRYYCYSSGESQVNVSVSDDMIAWERLGAALNVSDRWHYWAPCVYYLNGTFYMYVSNRPAGSEDPHEEVLQLATSPNPEGPFETQHKFFSTFSIDPHVVPDGRGSWTMFYSVNDVTGLDSSFTGTSIVGDQLEDFDRLAGKPRPIIVPTLDEEIFEPNRFADGRDWYTIEGATYFTRHGWAYMTYSGNAYERENYFIGYARAKLTEDAPHELNWQKVPNDYTWQPLIKRNQQVEGTGHNSIVRAPNLIDDWIVYHGRNAQEPITAGVEERVMRMDALRYVGNDIVTDAPTFSPQLAPSRPTVFESFSGPDLSSDWNEIGDGQLSFNDAVLKTDSGLKTLLHNHASSAYVAEVWFKMQQSDLGARAGFILAWHDERNYSEALVDAATKKLLIRNWVDGIGSDVGTAEIGSFKPDAWHSLSVTRKYQQFTVTLNDFPRVTFTLPTGFGSDGARTGVTSVHTHTQFSAFTLTDHVTLEGEDLGAPGAPFSAQPSVVVSDEGIFARGSQQLELNSARSANTVTTHTCELLSPTSRIALTPWDDGAGESLEVEITKNEILITHKSGTNQAQTTTIPRTGGPVVAIQTKHLPTEFQVYIDSWEGNFTAPNSHQFSQRIRLERARLTRYEETDISQSIKKDTKEQ